jgi:hypothetical protein
MPSRSSVENRPKKSYEFVLGPFPRPEWTRQLPDYPNCSNKKSSGYHFSDRKWFGGAPILGDSRSRREAIVGIRSTGWFVGASSASCVILSRPFPYERDYTHDLPGCTTFPQTLSRRTRTNQASCPVLNLNRPRVKK